MSAWRPTWWVIFIALLATSGCKTSQGLSTKKTDDIPAGSVLATWTRLHTYRLPAMPWGGKGKLDIQSPALNMQVNVQWHTISGQYLWLSISKLGIETHRILLRPDSVFIMDRLSRQYLFGDINRWLEEQDVPFTYQDLDRLWYGLPLDHPLKNIHTEKKPQGWTISGVDAYDIHYAYQMRQNTLPAMYAQRDAYELQVDQSNFQAFTEQLSIPYKRQIKFRNEDHYAFDLDIAEIKTNYPREIGWRIPDGYDQIELK